MAVKQGILQSFSAVSWTASVLLPEATSFYLSNVPCNTALSAATAIAGAFCAVLFFDEQDPTNAVVLACYPNGATGIPGGAAGTITYITPHQFMTNQVVNNGSTAVVTIGGSGGVPSGASGVLVNAWITNAATFNSYAEFGPHGGLGSGNYPTIGNQPQAPLTTNGSFIVPLASNAIDVAAHGDNLTINLYAYGYTS